MDVFSLDQELIDQYEAFARSFTRVKSCELQEKVDTLYAERKFWPEPLVQLNPHYESGGSISELVASDGLAPECAEIFSGNSADRNSRSKSLKLRRHQQQAISLALGGKSYVVTTGTGSGKSLCFFIPIVDAIIKAKKAGEPPKTQAIIIYPMNALANSQLEELKKFVSTAPTATSVTFARYTGQESQEEREKIKNEPPDILLTNFMMLELLMTRQHDLDQRVIENCQNLKFIVLDELHTYRGRQGADVAMLMRRLRARVGDPARPPIYIGTSATMVSEEQVEDREQVVSDIASRLFGTEISRDAIVTETLKRATDPSRSADQGLSDLGRSVDQAAGGMAYHSKTNTEIASDPLAIWVETRLGLADVEHKPIRAKPLSVDEAAEKLSKESGREKALCRKTLQTALLAFSLSEKDRGVANGSDSPLFAFKLHQFISGAGRLYITLDQEGDRTVMFDGQIYDPANPEKRLYATHFCRRCGQEHHPVTMREIDGVTHIEKREIDDLPAGEDDETDGNAGRWGFLMPEPHDDDFKFEGRDENYPDLWLEERKSGELRLKSSYRKTRAELLHVRPNGEVKGYGRRAWFMPGRFKFCPACRDFHSDSTRDINRLASLSAEGRSSATTVLIATILRWMSAGEAGIDEHTRKLLAFTDNRQDAALQAGHFNDFIFVTLLRGAILATLSQAEGDGFDESEIGAAVQKMLGFLGTNETRRTEWLIEPGLKGANLITAERTMRDVLTHRFWVDQRRGWRFTNPNLEQLGLIEARYTSLDEMAKDLPEFNKCPILQRATSDERIDAARVLFDHMRKGLAIECDALDIQKTESLAKRMGGLIKAPWRMEEENVAGATTFMTKAPSRKEIKLRDEVLILRGSPQSAIGRVIRAMKFGGTKPANQHEVTEVIDGLLQAASSYGLVTSATSAVGGEGWRLLASSVSFGLDNGSKEPERDNSFFQKLYQGIADLLLSGGSALFGFEGREHTAQVESELRELREARFRYSEEDQKTLSDNADVLKEFKEDLRFLPTLFCSPTMELGVDISSMNVVYMRNTPPTPANYAQRSGRAGRSGQAALVVTYCAAQSPHDQYYFQKPKDMVDGVVRPPSIDLTNPDLVESHLHAEWLAASGVALSASIADNLDMTADNKPLKTDHWEILSSEDACINGEKQVSKVLETLSDDFRSQKPHWFTNTTDFARAIANTAPDRVNKTFDRWRDLLASAEQQVADATKTLDDYSISPQERKAAEFRLMSGNTQRKLLLGSSKTQGSDFYVYRYLATEGFLPGYNFPRLPLMAFVPGGQGGKGQRYIQRARFLAISEFGPQSLVYHEGRAYRVDRALLKEAGGGPEGHLPTFSTSICSACGASHDGETPENCTVCGHSLGASDITRQLYRIENVGTKPAERITANDEDRRRQGFDLQTTFSFQGERNIVTRLVRDDDGDLLKISFAPAALVRRINKGLRRRKDENEIGFVIDPKSGRWVGADKQDDKEQSPTNIRQRITPVVEDRKNAMLIRFPVLAEHMEKAEMGQAMVTLQHAFARGIETVYQLEEGEILVEPTPSRKNRRALLFYEAAEGGAGALSRLVGDENGIRRVTREALAVMHYDLSTLDTAHKEGSGSLVDVPGTQCVAGCYRCLLSYFNQPDQEYIDRRNSKVLDLLVRLAHAQAHEKVRPTSPSHDLEDCPPPDPSPLQLDGHSVPLIWRSARIAAIEEQSAAPGLADQLATMGIELIVLPTNNAARAAKVAELAAMLEGVVP